MSLRTPTTDPVSVLPSDPTGALEVRLGYQFADRALLDRALSHRSWCSENGGMPSNERLEFLGDAVLGWAIADLAFHRFGDVPEGRLTDLRKSVVNATALAVVAAEIGIGPHLKLGKGEAASGGASRPSILSDAFEAVLAAVYLDGGAEPAFALVERFVAPYMSQTVGGPALRDYKTELQELCARIGTSSPSYVLTSVGPDHAKTFTAEVLVGGRSVGSGEGGSKKSAEQAAAAAACAVLG
jgi:ribonuclease-3